MNSDRVCPAGLECPEGMYRQPDLTNNYCRKGYYCPRGDINPYPVPCPTGTYSENTGLKQVSECTACTAGWYCNQEGLTAPEATCPGGYYCPRGTGDYTIYACPIGYYRNGSAKESFQDCAECTSGYYCDEEGLATPKDCPRGNLIIWIPLTLRVLIGTKCCLPALLKCHFSILQCEHRSDWSSRSSLICLHTVCLYAEIMSPPHPPPPTPLQGRETYCFSQGVRLSVCLSVCHKLCPLYNLKTA